MRSLHWIVLLTVAGTAGFFVGQWWQQPEAAPAPDGWLAQVGNEFITRDEFVAEMERRGGRRPGQYQSVEQRRMLLNEMVIRRALVDAARSEGLHRQPEVRRAMDSVLINRYRQSRLQPLRDAVDIDPDEVETFYEQHADQYVVPARKRIAMIHIEVPERAPEERWEQAARRAERVLAGARELELPIPHFGDLAREHSDHQASRYRGGVIGWLSEEPVRPRFNPVVARAAETLDEVGEMSGVLRGNDGFYIVRLVQAEPKHERSLEQLSGGIRQRIMSERLRAVEERFLDARLAEAAPEINDAALEEIDPLSDPHAPPEGPPDGPTGQGDES